MTINFDEYLAEDTEEEIKIQEPSGKIDETIDFNQYLETSDNGLFKEARRHLSRIGSRIGETVVGLPGDIVKFTEWLGDKLPDTPKFLEREPNFLQKAGRQFLENIPGSSELKTKMSEITEGFTDPQSATEEFGDSIIELASALTIGKDPTKVTNLLSSLGKSAAAKGAKEGAALLGAGEKGQAATELGTLFFASLMGKPLANEMVSDKYRQARGAIPEGARAKTNKLTKGLMDLEDQLSKGISTASKKEVKGAVSELFEKAKKGDMLMEEIVESYHDINERMTSKKLFDDLSKSERKKLKFRYDKFKDEVSKEIKEYGKSNPEFYKKWQDANLGYATIENSKKVTSFLEGHVGKLPSKVASGMAIELFLGHPEIAAGTAGTFAALKTGELLSRVANSPLLRKHYLDVINAAIAENVPAFVKSMNKLEKGMEKSFTHEESKNQ